MSKRQKIQQSEPVQRPEVAAFAIAQELAAKAVRDWMVSCDSGLENRNKNVSACYDEICRHSPEGDTEPVIHAALKSHITDRSVLIEVSDLVGVYSSNAMDAGFSYGLALGLALAKSGAR